MFRLSIRDIFWVILVVAMGLGWFVDRSTLARDAKAMGTGIFFWGHGVDEEERIRIHEIARKYAF